MDIARYKRRIVMLVALVGVLFGLAPAATAFASSATTGTGWIRLAHLSPAAPAVDVYLYSFGDSSAHIVLHHVAYGTVSPYEAVTAGDYSVAMRPSGAPATSQPVLSTSVTVVAGHAYTVAGVGPKSGLRLQVMDDDLTTPAGKALVRVVQASLKQPTVTVSWDGTVVTKKLSFDTVTSYQAVAPGTEMVSVTGGAGGTGTAARDSSRITLASGTVHTLVILDGASGLEIANLEDAAGSGRPPAGGAATGFGGTAPHGPGSPLPWLVLIGAGALLAVGGGRGYRRLG
jgi:hypothetical protein